MNTRKLTLFGFLIAGSGFGAQAADQVTPLQSWVKEVQKAGAEPSPVSVTATLIERDGAKFFALRLTNISSAPLKTSSLFLPWARVNVLNVVGFTTDRKALNYFIPISDPLSASLLTIAPGETRTGVIKIPDFWDPELTVNLPSGGQAETLVRDRDIVVLWSYRFLDYPEPKRRNQPCTGVIVISKSK